MNSARELTSRLADLLRREHGALADFLVALSDFDRCRLWEELGHPSLFQFLRVELGLSKGAAHYRKVAAELVQRCPEVVEPLRDGRLCFSTVVELAKVLTPENRDDVLPRFLHRSKREAMAEVAAIRPVTAPPSRELVTAATPPRRIEETRAADAGAQVAVVPPTSAPEEIVHPVEPPRHSPRPAPEPRRDESVPLTADLARLHVTVSRRFLAKLEAARAALSHARPGATAEQILEAGLDLVLAQHAKRKGLVARPQPKPRPSKPDHVPAQVRREVWKRDAGRCQHPLQSGGICGSTERVELHHLVPRALGGPATIENLSLRCRFHNDLAARNDYGEAFMSHFTRGRTRGAPVLPDEPGLPSSA